MPYNRDIAAFAPFPKGALPTETEMATLRRRARAQEIAKVTGAVRRLFGA